MSKRTDRELLSDIKEAVKRILSYVQSVGYENFMKDTTGLFFTKYIKEASIRPFSPKKKAALTTTLYLVEERSIKRKTRSYVIWK